ncbi:hypothetical protein C8R46DRAFT_1050813 [Mycena filopes]|nr:hypothetical protein C8R46DRAFT_1050813 [Mycena filopes]
MPRDAPSDIARADGSYRLPKKTTMPRNIARDASGLYDKKQTNLTQGHSFTSRRRAIVGAFSPAREVFLTRFLPGYYDAFERKTLPTEFWPALYSEYWMEFPWRLPFDTDPHCAMTLDVRGEVLSPEDVDAQTATHLITNSKLRAWFHRQRYHRDRLASAAAAAADTTASTSTSTSTTTSTTASASATTSA